MTIYKEYTDYYQLVIDGREVNFLMLGNKAVLFETFDNGEHKKKLVKFEYDNDGNLYALQKTQIKFDNAAHGFIAFVERCYKAHFMEDLAKKVILYAVDQVKEYKPMY